MPAAFACIRRLVPLISAIAVSTGYACAEDGFPVSEPNAHVHVMMPAKPVFAVTQDRDAKSKSGGVKQEKSWKVIRNGAMWLVSSIVIPKDVAYGQLSNMAVNIAVASKAALIDRQPINLDGVEGLEFLFRDKEFINRWRIFLINPQTLVDIRYVGPPGTENSDDVQRYFDTFALSGGPKTPAPRAASPPVSADLIERLKGKTIRIGGLLSDELLIHPEEKPFKTQNENWPLTLDVRDDGVMVWGYRDAICPADGSYKAVDILFGNRKDETPLMPGYRKEDVKCGGDSSRRMGQVQTTMSATMQGSYTTVRLVTGNIMSLSQEFKGSAKKHSTGRADVFSIASYRSKFNISISFGEKSCEVVKVDWQAGTVETDHANPKDRSESSRTIRVAEKTYCIFR